MFQFTIEVPEELVERLPQESQYRRRMLLERAIHAALDSEGWPSGIRGEINVPITYWFVNIFEKTGRLRGHVGPIHDVLRAKDVAKSWRKTGVTATVAKTALGPSLTNRDGGYG